MTEPQVWVLIGVFASSMFAMTGLTSTWFVHILRAEIGGLRAEMIAKFERVDAQFERVDAKFELVDAKFELVDEKLMRMNDRFDHLDRDIQAIAKRVFPEHG
jgi:hypothetical protein